MVNDSEHRHIGTVRQFVEVRSSCGCVGEAIGVVQHDAGDGEFAALGRLDRKQRVIDRAQTESGHNQQRKTDPRREVGN